MKTEIKQEEIKKYLNSFELKNPAWVDDKKQWEEKLKALLKENIWLIWLINLNLN